VVYYETPFVVVVHYDEDTLCFRKLLIRAFLWTFSESLVAKLHDG